MITVGTNCSMSSILRKSTTRLKASATEYYFSTYPEEKTTVTEDFFVVRAGTFVAPVTVIESLYAPHYRANSGFRAPLQSEAL